MTLNYVLRQSSIMLVVEDDETRNQIQSSLDSSKFQVVYPSETATAIEFAEEHKPNVIIVDANAQWLGTPLIRHLVQLETWHGLVVAFAPANEHEIITHALAEGAIDYFQFPLPPELLEHRIQLLLDANIAKSAEPLLEKISDAVIITDKEMVITRWNQAAETIYGWRASDAIGQPLLDLIPTDFGENTTLEAVTQHLISGELWEGKIRQTAKDNTERIIEASLHPIFHDAQTVAGYIGIHRDITKSLQTQEALKISNQRINKLFNQAPVMLYSVDEDGQIIEVNDQWLKVFGYERDEVIGQRAVFNMTTESKARAEQQLSSEQDVEAIEYQFVCKNGMVLDGLLDTKNIVTESSQSVTLYTIRDITAQNFTAQSLRESEREMRSILNAIQDLILVLDADGRCVKVASPKTDDFPISTRSMLGKQLNDLFPDTNEVDLNNLASQVLETDETQGLKLQSKADNKSRWYYVTLSSMAKESRIVCVIRDITQQTATESAVLDSEMRYRQLFENAQDAIFVVDAESDKIIDVNHQAIQQLGYAYDEMLTKTMSEIEIPFDFVSTEKFSLNIHGKDQFVFENTYRRKDGTTFPVENRSQLLMLDGKRVILSFARDISERKEIEATEREQRRLADALRDTAAALTSTLELDEVLNLILDSVYKGIKSQFADIYFVEGNKAIRKRHRGDVVAQDNVEFIIDDTYMMRQLAQTQKVQIINDTQTLGGDWVVKDDLSNVRSLIGAPIIYELDLIGFLFLADKEPNKFTKQQAQYLQIFANQAAIAIQNARLFENIQHHANELETKVNERTRELVDANEALQKEIGERLAIELRMKEEHNLLQTLIDSIPDAIYVKDLDHRFLLGNQALLRELHTSDIGAVIGKTDHDFFKPEKVAEFIAQEQMVMQSGRIFHEFVSGEDKDHNRLIFITKLPFHDSDGNIAGLVGINQDITALSQAEAELQSERNLLRTLIDHLPDFIFVKDTDSRFILGNQTVLQYYGLQDHTDLIGRTAAELNDPKPSDKTINEDKRVLEGHPVINEEFSFYERGTGNRRWSLSTKVPLTNSAGETTGIVGVDHDITDVKRAEEQLQQIMTSARCLLWFAIVNKTDQGFDWNLHIANEDSAQQFLPVSDRGAGYTQAWLASTHIEDRWNRHEAFRQAVDDQSADFSRDFRIHLENGDVRWLNENVQIRKLTAGRWSLVGVCTDITELKEAEASLQTTNQELEQRVEERTSELTQINDMLRAENVERRRAEEAERDQRMIAEALRDTVAALNSTLELDKVLDRLLGSITTVVSHEGANIMLLDGNSAEIVRAWGYPSNMTENWENVHDINAYHQVMTTGEPHVTSNTEDDKDWIPMIGFEWVKSSILVPIKLHDSIIGFLNLDSSIADNFNEEHGKRLQPFANQAGIAIQNARMVQQTREYADLLEVRVKERTAELEEERAQLRAILDSMRDGVIYQTRSGATRYINQALVDLTEFQTELWIGDHAEQQVLDFDMQEDGDQLQQEMTRHLDKQGFWESEFKVKRADDSVFDASITRIVVKDADKPIGTLTVLRDISLDKQLEAQKARFIASASHELRTPIANLKTRLYLIRKQQHKLHEHLDVAESVAKWMQSLVETMFDIARFQRGIIELEKSNVILQKIIIDVEQFQQPSAREKHVEIIRDFVDDLVLIQADPDRLTQVLINLVGNAINHTPEKGTVTLRLDQIYDDEKEQQLAVIQISDTGSGIPPETLPHIFQPFYQADKQKRGAGLGLSIAKEIIDLHKGEISVDSTLGEGTTFTIKLPQATGNSAR